MTQISRVFNRLNSLEESVLRKKNRYAVSRYAVAGITDNPLDITSQTK